MRTWFESELETVATYWRLWRRDGVALGFTSHDRDLRFGGLVHRAAPGMVPSAVQLGDGLEPESMDVAGALTHRLISATDIAAGRWDGARLAVGLVDWEMVASEAPEADSLLLAVGELGTIERQGSAFRAELTSAKSLLDAPVAPATSPSCRADFCGPGCTLSAARFTRLVRVATVDAGSGDGVAFEGLDAGAAADFVDGTLRWIDGANAGLGRTLWNHIGAQLVLSDPMPAPVAAGDLAELVEGCDKSLATCAGRFGNALNFQGEPHLPGNDLLTRFPG